MPSGEHIEIQAYYMNSG